MEKQLPAGEGFLVTERILYLYFIQGAAKIPRHSALGKTILKSDRIDLLGFAAVEDL